MKSIFSYQGLVWRCLNFLTDMLCLSLIWLVCSLPVFTVGAATTALYDSVTHGIRYREGRAYRRYFECFKREFKLATLSTLLWGVIAGIGVFILLSLRQLSTYMESAAVAAAAWYIVLVIPLGAACWAFPIISRFTLGFADNNITAFKLALAHLPSTAILVLLVMEIARFCIGYFFPLFFAPVLLMLLASLFIEPVFAKYGGGLKRCDSDGNPIQDNDNP